MNFISRSASRLIALTSVQNVSKSIGCIFPQSQWSVRPLTRSLVVLSTPSRMNSNKQMKHTNLCSCGCGIHGMHTQGDKELVDFLTDEISSEKATLVSIPSKLDEFSVQKDQAELTFVKNFNDETISISINVNHTVETDASPDAGGDQEGKLSSRPDFEVDVKVGSKVLSFSCQYNPPRDVIEGEISDLEDKFHISELTVYKGTWEEKSYCASGDILDGVMYDLLMNYLEERGITSNFAEKLSTFCTNYEQALYVDMLQDLQSFIKRK